MSGQSKYFNFVKNGNIHILSDRMPLNWKEILVFPLISFLIVGFLSTWLVGFVVCVINFFLYTLFRFSAWFYYSETHFNENTNSITQYRKLINKPLSIVKISDKINKDNFNFIEINRSGKIKYLFQYTIAHKPIDLLIVKTKEDKSFIENYLDKDW